MKRLSLLLAVLVVAMLTVQCGPAPTPEVVEKVVKETVVVEVEKEVEVTKVVEKEVEKVVTPTPEPFTLTVWAPPSMPDRETEERLMGEINRRFEAEHPGVTVDWVFVPWDVVFTKNIAAIVSGETPDVGVIGSDAAITFASMGALEPIDDVLEELGGPDRFLSQEVCQWSDHYWCVMKVTVYQLLFYRKDILKEAGYDEPPKTWEELIEIAQKINRPEEDFYALGLDYSAGNACQQIFQGIMHQAGAVMLDEDCKVALDSPETGKALQFYYDLYHKYKVIPLGAAAISKYISTETPLDEWYGTGKIAMTMRFNVSAARGLPANYPEVYAKTGFAPFPAGPSGHSGSFFGNAVMFVHRQSKHADVAKEYVKHFFEQKDMQEEYFALHGSISPIKDYHPATEKEPWYQAALEVAPYGVRTGWKCVHPNNGPAEEAFVLPVMVQDVVLNDGPIDQAMKEAQAKYEQIYSR